MIAENTFTKEAKNDLNKINETKKAVKRYNLVYRTNQYAYSFKNFGVINTIGRDIYNVTITLKQTE